MSKVLDCGHGPSPHGAYTTGTAHTPDGKEICWNCSNEEQRQDLEDATDYVGYLSEDGKEITTWPGGKLADVTYYNPVKYYGFYGIPFTRVFWRATDGHGQLWHGSSPGRGMYARMHKNKRQPS
jgi:hypothetical protein